MPQDSERTVVVAVADADAGPALAYAAAEVGRRGGRVRVAHVVPALDLPGLPEPMVVDHDTLRRAGSEVVDGASAALEHVVPDAVVLPTLLHGPTVLELVRCSRQADLVVVQRRPRGWRRAVTLSTSTGVAAHAHAPVAVVPSEWAPTPEREPRVVVGMEDVLSSPRLLEVALEETAARRGRLRIVHAWLGTDQYDDFVYAGAAATAHEDELRKDLTRDLHPVLKRHPGLDVELVVEHAHPADLLVGESDSAGLLVVGRHLPALTVGAHLGSVVRAVLRESSCPVLVVDASRPT